MGIDITKLPGMGGSTGSIVYETVSTLEDAALCIGTESLLSCFEAVIDLARLAYDLYLDLFPSRPKVGKDSASDDTALFFIPSSNPVIALWGVGIRSLEAQGIPTSVSGGPGYTAELNLANAVLADLKKQYDAPGAPQFTVNGVPANGTQIFDWYHLLGFQTNHPDSNAAVIQQRELLDRTYDDMVNSGFIDPQTGFPKPPPGPPPPPPPPKCPPGYQWDPVAQRCSPIPPKPCPPGQHWDAAVGRCVPDPTVEPQPYDPDNDEFVDCCDETQIKLNQLLQALGAMGSNASDASCCANVVSAIGAVTTQLAKIALLIAPANNTPGVDLTAVIAQLTAIAAGVGKLAGGAVAPVAVHIENPLPLATATATAPPTDVAGIVKAISELVNQGDVDQSILNYLTDNGFMTPADAQIISGAKWANALVGIFRTYGWNALTWALSLVGITYNGHKFVFGSITAAISADIDAAVQDALKVGAAPLYPVIKGLVDAVVAQLRPAHPVAIGDSGVDPDLLLAKTLAPALIVNAVMLVASYLGWDSAEQLREYVDIISALVGLEEIKEIQVGTLMHAGPIAAARLQAQRQFRQTIPGPGAMAGWASRGITDQRAMLPLMQMDGLHDQLSDLYFEAAYSGINPRQLIRLMNTGLFSNADITDELTFAGIRPASQHRLLLAAPYLASDGERKQLRAELEAAYGQGLLSSADLTEQLDSAEQNTDRNSLVLAKVSLQSQVTLTKALETEFTTGYVAGATTQPVYEQQIRGLPIQPWKADAIIGVAEARRNAALFRQDAAAARALERATAAVERRTAMKSYASGFSNAAELTAALLLTGLTATEAVAWSALAALQKEGNVRWTYGMQLTPEAATILKQRVAAITDQRKHALMTDAQYEEALKLLKLPDNWINALRAAANATLTPAKQRTFTAVSTN
jgi:hypothetical protein